MRFTCYIFGLLAALHQVKCAMDPSTLYVYAYSWTPGFCDNQSYPGCKSPEAYWNTNLTIHGLWPQYNTTGYPSACSTEPFDPAVPESIGMTNMIQYWTNVQSTETSADYDSFWEHEWSKHGTCTGLSQHDYFNNAIKLTFSVPTPSVLSNSVGKNMRASDLRTSFCGSDHVSLQCHDSHLTGVYTCWAHNNGIPTTQIACPSSVVKEDTCISDDEIMILSL